MRLRRRMAMPKDDPFGVYELLTDSAKMARDVSDWAHQEAQSIRKATAKARSSGTPVVTAEQDSFKVRVTGRRHFWALLGNAFTVLFEGSVTMSFRRRK